MDINLILLGAVILLALVGIANLSILIGIKKDAMGLLHKQQDQVPRLLAAVPPELAVPTLTERADLEPMPHAAPVPAGKQGVPGVFTIAVTGDTNKDLAAITKQYVEG
jgi:hypothetical protein